MSEISKVDLKVSEHAFVPKHEIVLEEDIPAILRRSNAKLEQFPYTLASDPVIKEIGGRPGDLIRITRSSHTAGQTTFYRFVVEG